MAYEVTQEDLISLRCRRVCAPHVVILGAGASIAACPDGDAQGRRLPSMADLIEVLDLGGLISSAGHDPATGFESLYSRLHAADSQSPLVKEIERRVEGYFSQLALPGHPTIYDLLLLSLRHKDAVFTFNWDPFLADAYERLAYRLLPVSNLPGIFHLHGNVRITFCEHCRSVMLKTDVCQTCGATSVPTPLLFPVEEKDYTDPYFTTQWDQARDFIGLRVHCHPVRLQCPNDRPEGDEHLSQRLEGRRRTTSLSIAWRSLTYGTAMNFCGSGRPSQFFTTMTFTAVSTIRCWLATHVGLARPSSSRISRAKSSNRLPGRATSKA